MKLRNFENVQKRATLERAEETEQYIVNESLYDEDVDRLDLVSKICFTTTDDCNHLRDIAVESWSFSRNFDTVGDSTGGKMVERHLDSKLMSGTGMEAEIEKIEKLYVSDNDVIGEKRPE